LQRGDQLFKDKEYRAAAELYDEVMRDRESTKEDKQTAAFRAGEAYRMNHNNKMALKYYKKAQKYGAKDPIILLRIGEALKGMGEYEDAIAILKQYQKANPSDSQAEVLIKGCGLAAKWKNEKSRYTVENFKKANESKVDDFSPMWADKKHKSIMFTSDRVGGESKKIYTWTARSFTDLYGMQQEGRKNPKWNNPTIVEGINTPYNDGVITFDKRYSRAYFTQCNGVKGDENTCKIYEARKSGKEWNILPEPLEFSADDKFNYGHPALSPDGKKLYFSSDRPSEFTDSSGPESTKDLWVVSYVRRGRTWSEPLNLGPTINTTGNEVFPYIHRDGSLYFSSDGHLGMGGLDIFMTTGTGTEWAIPQNLKSPMNSNGDDFGIIMNDRKDQGFFTSDRLKGDDDIYEFFMEPILCTLRGTVTDCDSAKAIANALVVISNNIDSTKIRLRTDDKGYYETPVEINTRYEIQVSKRSEYFYDAKPKMLITTGVTNSDECQYVKNFCLKNQCNDVFVLPIYYDLDKAFLREESKKILGELVATLKKYPKMKVELGSHTDCRATYEYNRALSQRRADSAVAYIIASGVNPFRVEARGYGESELVNDCYCEGVNINPCEEDEHQLNRRTTVKVVNCNFDVKSIGVDYKNKNDSALVGRGSVFSPFLLDEQRAYLTKTKGNIDSFMRVREIQDSIAAVKAEEAKMLARYDIIPLQRRGDKYYVTGYVDRKRIKFTVDPESFRTEIPQNQVEQMLNSGQLKISDFKDGKTKIKLSNGEKVYSKSFVIPKLKVGNIVFENVRCKMSDLGKKPVLGSNVFRKYEDLEIKEDNKLWLLKEEDE
jgi:peptidoglycan-associated lipoprotein